MGLTVAEIADRLGGRVEGDGTLEISGVASLEAARPGQLSFLSNPKYAAFMQMTRAAAVIVGDAWSGASAAALIRVKDADAAFAQAALWLARPPVVVRPGIHPTAVIAEGVSLGRDVSIGPYCVLEPGVRIGDRTVLGACGYLGHEAVVGEDCRFYPQVTVREYTRIGNRAIIHNGAVIGSDGFGYVKEGCHWKKIPQVGVVVIGDDVEIGANTTIDRARFGETRIGNGVKIDNLVQIAHNVTIGDDTAIAGQAGISGSTQVGARVMLGGQAGLSGHIRIGDDAVVGAQAGVTKDVPAATFVSGYPAMPHKEALKVHANLMRLPEWKKKVADMDIRLKTLEGKS